MFRALLILITFLLIAALLQAKELSTKKNEDHTIRDITINKTKQPEIKLELNVTDFKVKENEDPVIYEH